jgi:hypothetical protein
MTTILKITFQGKIIAQGRVPIKRTREQPHREALEISGEDNEEPQEIVFWLGEVSGCQTCSMKFGTSTTTTVFYDMMLARDDGKTGKWACMCSSCALGGQGVGKLGVGYGQRYDRQIDGRWKLTAGDK